MAHSALNRESKGSLRITGQDLLKRVLLCDLRIVIYRVACLSFQFCWQYLAMNNINSRIAAENNSSSRQNSEIIRIRVLSHVFHFSFLANVPGDQLFYEQIITICKISRHSSETLRNSSWVINIFLNLQTVERRLYKNLSFRIFKKLHSLCKFAVSEIEYSLKISNFLQTVSFDIYNRVPNRCTVQRKFFENCGTHALDIRIKCKITQLFIYSNDRWYL